MLLLSHTIAVLMVYSSLEGVATHFTAFNQGTWMGFLSNCDKFCCRSGLSAANKNKALFNVKQNYTIDDSHSYHFNIISCFKLDYFSFFFI